MPRKHTGWGRGFTQTGGTGRVRSVLVWRCRCTVLTGFRWRDLRALYGHTCTSFYGWPSGRGRRFYTPGGCDRPRWWFAEGGSSRCPRPDGRRAAAHTWPGDTIFGTRSHAPTSSGPVLVLPSRSRYRRPAAATASSSSSPTDHRPIFVYVYFYGTWRIRRRTVSPPTPCGNNERYDNGGRTPPDRCFFRPTPNSEFLQRPTAFAANVSSSIFDLARANVLYFCSIGNDGFVKFSFQTLEITVLRLWPSPPLPLTTFRSSELKTVFNRGKMILVRFVSFFSFFFL